MKNALKIAAMVAGIYTFPTHADVTLNYELSGPDMESSTKTISISRFFARIDDPAEPDSFLLYQAGKFFPLYRINESAATYTLLTPEVNPTLHAGITPKTETTQEKSLEKAAETATTEPASASDASTKADHAETTTVKVSKASDSKTIEAVAEQAAEEKIVDKSTEETKEKPKTTLRLTKKSKTIAGVHCRMVEELVDDQPVMTHCMADKARLGITERETRTLSRVFEMARKHSYGWLGTATTDEQFVSIASQDLESKKTLQLKSHSTEFLPAGHLRVPRDFKKVPN